MYNYFLSTHLTNPRFRNNLNTFTRFFSESNTKLRTTITGLGNVFRNARWSDFKVQNVKTLLTNRYALTLVLFVSLIVFYNTSLSSNYQWFSALLGFEVSIDWIVELNLYFTTIYLTWLLRPNPVNRLTRTLDYRNNVEPAPSTLTFNPYLLRGLEQHTSYYSVLVDLHGLVTLQPHTPKVVLPWNVSTSFFQKNPSLLDESNYSIHTRSDRVWSQNFDLTTSLNLLNTSKHANLSRHLLLQSATYTLDTNRQERWLVKNSPTSSRTRLWNKRSVYTKRFIASSVMNSKYSDRNLWASNFGTAGTVDSTYLPSKLINAVVVPDKVLLNSFNTFEESRNFFNKRYMFLVNSSLLTGSKTVSIPASPVHKYSNLMETFSNTTYRELSYFNNDLLTLQPTTITTLAWDHDILAGIPRNILTSAVITESLVSNYALRYLVGRVSPQHMSLGSELHHNVISDHIIMGSAREVTNNSSNQTYNNVLSNQATFYSLLI